MPAPPTMLISPQIPPSITQLASAVFAQHQHPFTTAHSSTILSHPPDSPLCPAGSRHYTGSLEVRPGRSLFFWQFESRNKPETDPVVVWLNGFAYASVSTGSG